MIMAKTKINPKRVASPNWNGEWRLRSIRVARTTLGTAKKKNEPPCRSTFRVLELIGVTPAAQGEV
jgi:hypothetical protein